MKELKINEIIILEDKLYRVEWTKWTNGKMQGNRAMLKLLREKELMSFIIKDREEAKCLNIQQ